MPEMIFPKELYVVRNETANGFEYVSETSIDNIDDDEEGRAIAIYKWSTTKRFVVKKKLA